MGLSSHIITYLLKISDRLLIAGFQRLSSRQKQFTCCCHSPAFHVESSPLPTDPAAAPSPAAGRNSGTPLKPVEPWWHVVPLWQSAPSLPQQQAGPEPRLFRPKKQERCFCYSLGVIYSRYLLELEIKTAAGKSICSEIQESLCFHLSGPRCSSPLFPRMPSEIPE